MSEVTGSMQTKSCEDKTRRMSARDRVFAAAKDLFYRYGIRAVGVESIASEAKTTKMSLYRAFACKDELVAEYLQESARAYWDWWDETVARYPGDPCAALVALFQGQVEKCESCDVRGCPMGNAAVELTEETHPGRQVIVAHSREKLRRLQALCEAAGREQPEQLARGLYLLMDGAFFSMLSLGASGPAESLPLAARALIEAHAPKAARRSKAAAAG